MIRWVAAGFAVLFTLVVAIIAIATVMRGRVYWWVPRVETAPPR